MCPTNDYLSNNGTPTSSTTIHCSIIIVRNSVFKFINDGGDDHDDDDNNNNTKIE